MPSELQLEQMTLQLITFGATITPDKLFPTTIPTAAKLIRTDPYGFAIATCLDRGTKAEIIWSIPYDMKTYLCHLDPQHIYRMSLEELAVLFNRLHHRPRYIHDAPKTIRDLTRIVIDECDGNASNIWKSRRAADVNRIFRSIHGVGPGIANMAVLLIEKAFDIRFSDRDRKNMNIKPDVHTMRVLYRLGASHATTAQAAITATRQMNPAYPGEIDSALWVIGRTWCHPNNPACLSCPMTFCCLK